MTARRAFRPDDLAADIAAAPLARGGTRFRLFPVYAEGLPLETITVPMPPGSIGPGPSDSQMYVVDASAKPSPYDPPAYVPPFVGATLPPALPDAQGHFDHIPVGSPQFLSAHLYGSVRHTLDIWQRALGRPIVWADADLHPRLELIPLLDWDNAQSGPGFLETGIWRGADGSVQPFALNFDVIAHETGHQILFATMGVPRADAISVPFLAFHEAFSDLIALLGVMHFPAVLRLLLQETKGNLYVLNLVNRFAETSATTQIRLISNLSTMGDVAGIALAPDGSWIDPAGLGRNQHAIAAPLSAAIFDVLVEVYQDTLVAGGLLPPEHDARGWTRAEVDAAFDDLHRATGRALRRFEAGFVGAIMLARDSVAKALAHVMLTVHPERLSFDEVAARFIEGMLEEGFGPLLGRMLDHFEWRGIDPTPFLRFVPARGGTVPGREREQAFRVLAASHGTQCAGCATGAARHVAAFIRAGHRASAMHNPASALPERPDRPD